MDFRSEVIAIVTGAGKGLRLPGKVKKQYLEFGGLPLIAHTISIFVACTEVGRIIVTVPRVDVRMIKELCACLFPSYPDGIEVIAGGKTRQDSVHKALRVCPSNTRYVLIHDAVRPFVQQRILSELIIKVNKLKAVIPVTEVKYTIKEVDKTKVLRTIDRKRLVQVNTPQVFDYQMIRSVYDQASEDRLSFTDDASVMEYYGHQVYVVKDSETNIKLTTETDLLIMKHEFKSLMKPGKD